MVFKPKPIADQVIVITGATSGIGLATAQALVKEGARLVLNARSQADLDAVAAQLGEGVVTVAGDIADPATSTQLAQTANDRFGGFDTWINNAGVGMWGKMEQGNLEDFKRLYDINFFGLVAGSLEALKTLKQRGGTLVNLGSVVSTVAMPIQGMYGSSKHAVKGFTDSLRIELAMENAPVNVVLVRPAAIGTPFTYHARNYLPNLPKLPPPVYEPAEVALTIVQALKNPQREVFAGGSAPMMAAMTKHAPGLSEMLFSKMLTPESQTEADIPADNPEGSLTNSSYPGAMTRNPLLKEPQQRSYYNRAGAHPVTVGLIAAGLAAGLTYLLRSRNYSVA